MKTIEDHHDEIHTTEPADWTHPVDLIEAEEEEDHQALDVCDIGSIPPNALAVLIRFLIPSRSAGNLTASNWKTVSIRIAALAHALGIEPIGSRPMVETAQAIGCSRAILSLLTIELRDFAGTGQGGGRSLEAREAYAERARRVWSRRTATQKARAADGLTPQATNETRSTSIV